MYSMMQLVLTKDNFNILNERLEVMEGEKLSDAVSLLSELNDSVSQQQDSEIKTDLCTNLASSQFNALRGEIDDVISCIMAARIGLIEYELGI